MILLLYWSEPPRLYADCCPNCGDPAAYTARQNTAYVDDALNYVSLCEACHELNAEHWADMWADYRMAI